MSKAKISAKDVIADIKAGMPDSSLMKKHGLSAQGLESVLRRLLQSGHITQNQLQNRLSEASEQPLTTVHKCPACKFPQDKDFEECPQCGVLVAKFKEKQQVKDRNEEAQRLQEEGRKGAALFEFE